MMSKPTFTTITAGVLTICAYTEFAPFAYEAAGQIVGTDIALLSRFAQLHKLALKLISRKPFADLWHAPGAGECDIAAAGIAMLPERDLGNQGVWSLPYMTVQRSLLIRREDAQRYSKAADFAGKKIVVTPNSTAHFDAIERYQPLGATVIAQVPSQHAIVQQLLNREIDAFGEGDASNAYLAQQYCDETGKAQLVLTDLHPMATVETLHFAVRAHDPRLVAALNEFIAQR